MGLRFIMKAQSRILALILFLACAVNGLSVGACETNDFTLRADRFSLSGGEFLRPQNAVNQGADAFVVHHKANVADADRHGANNAKVRTQRLRAAEAGNDVSVPAEAEAENKESAPAELADREGSLSGEKEKAFNIFAINEIKNNEQPGVSREKYETLLLLCQKEITRLYKERHIKDYFVEIHRQSGEIMKLEDFSALDSKALQVHEYCPLIVENYDQSLGAVALRMHFVTPYKEGQKVLILLGFLNLAPDRKTVVKIDWVAVEAEGFTDEAKDAPMSDGLAFTLSPELLERCEGEITMLAVVSE